MKFKIKVTSGLYCQNQYQKSMNFDYSSGYPEMSCFDYNAIETYFQNLTGQIKVDDSITNWTLSWRSNWRKGNLYWKTRYHLFDR